MKIAFGGKMGSGKDSAADFLCKHYGGRRCSFAEPLYEILRSAQRVCGLPFKKDRKFLQFVGTEWGRAQDPELWINLLLKRTQDPDTNYFLSDVRFPNELERLKADGWFCILLHREQSVPNREGTGSKVHPSELSLPESEAWDMVLNNNASLADLFSDLVEFIEDYKLV
jgi:hypothetical protein